MKWQQVKSVKMQNVINAQIPFELIKLKIRFKMFQHF